MTQLGGMGVYSLSSKILAGTNFKLICLNVRDKSTVIPTYKGMIISSQYPLFLYLSSNTYVVSIIFML